MHFTVRGRGLVAGGLVAGGLLAGAPGEAAESSVIREVIVTGSRLPRQDLAADSPILTVDSEAVQRSGVLTTEVILNRLPQVTPSFSSASNNPSANGAAYVNLRGLGPSRNLVLLDGRRVIGANASNSVDLNTIPPPLIDRIEIITGGASAVYGADALAGVVNIILKDRFDGLEAQGRTLISERGDGREGQLSVTAGRKFSAGKIMANLTWSKRDEIGKGARSFSAQATEPTGYLPSGSWFPGPNPPSVEAVNAVFGRYGVGAGEVSPRGGDAGFGFNGDGSLIGTGMFEDPQFDARNYRGALQDVATLLYPDVYSYNFQPSNKLILPLEATSGTLLIDARVAERITVYGQALATRYSASTALAPAPAPATRNPLYPGLGVQTFTIPVTNPFIPADLAELLASRRGDSPALAGSGPTEEFQYRFRAVSLGPRQTTNRADSLNLTGGIRADLGSAWSVETYATWGEYKRTEDQAGLLSIRRFEQLLDSPTGGTEYCAGGFNPFGPGISRACADFLRVPVRHSTDVRMENAVVQAQGPLFVLPAGPVEAAVGVEYRQVRFSYTRAAVSAGEVAGLVQFNNLNGSLRSGDLFVEVQAPLLADMPLAKRLEVTLGLRRTDERGADPAYSYKGEFVWTVTEEVRMRGSAQRAVRSPDIFERFEPPAAFFGIATDPCAEGPLRTTAVQALCRNQARSAGFTTADADGLVQESADVQVLHRGDPEVEPEHADTFTLGMVWRPALASDWASGVEASIDGYKIRIGNAIGYSDPQAVLNACYNIGGATNPGYDPANATCAPIRRSSVDFSIVDIETPRANQGLLETAGVDVALQFRTDLAAIGKRSWLGSLSTAVVVSWLAYYRDQPSPLQLRTDYAGTLADAVTGYQSMPRWRGLMDFGWNSGPAGLHLSGRFVDAMTHRALKLDPAAAASGVGRAWYWDLSGSLALGDHAELRAGVLNLFDRRPELYSPSVDAGTEPSTYDVIGRRYWVSLVVRL